MIDPNDDIYYLLEEMIRKGLASTSSTWLEIAVQQKNPRLSIGIASSKMLFYDRMDCKLITLSKCN